jgi:hypothetical protein
MFFVFLFLLSNPVPLRYVFNLYVWARDSRFSSSHAAPSWMQSFHQCSGSGRIRIRTFSKVVSESGQKSSGSATLAFSRWEFFADIKKMNNLGKHGTSNLFLFVAAKHKVNHIMRYWDACLYSPHYSRPHGPGIWGGVFLYYWPLPVLYYGIQCIKSLTL